MGRASGQPQWVKKDTNSPASSGQGDVNVVLDSLSERPAASSKVGSVAAQGATSQSFADEAAEAFPPLAAKPAPEAGAQRWEGSPTSDSNGDACVAAATSTQQLLDEVNKLKRELEVTKQREASHRSNADKIRHDIQRCSFEAAAAAKEETRLLSEASAARFRGGGQREAVRTHSVEIQEQIADYARRAADHEQQQRGWREELESMSRQQAKAADHVEELQRANASLKDTANQQNACLAKAEARVKRLESRRAALKTEAQKLQQQLKMQLEGSTDEAGPLHGSRCTSDEASPVEAEPRRKSGSAKTRSQTKGGSPDNQAKARVLDRPADNYLAPAENLPWKAMALAAFSVALAYLLLPKFNAE
eukprot:TRINITY_DN29234_c0_g1_i1.p1 TRINITY_DN29234_c0_g1~~TRINITY_DN29234_c0_g1_i1.p1  ORF type:complete len:363 (+),score=90.83 TRINITY_DN29234_c0_g1_i1:165-1253(+)